MRKAELDRQRKIEDHLNDGQRSSLAAIAVVGVRRRATINDLKGDQFDVTSSLRTFCCFIVLVLSGVTSFAQRPPAPHDLVELLRMYGGVTPPRNLLLSMPDNERMAALVKLEGLLHSNDHQDLWGAAIESLGILSRTETMRDLAAKLTAFMHTSGAFGCLQNCPDVLLDGDLRDSYKEAKSAVPVALGYLIQNAYSTYISRDTLSVVTGSIEGLERLAIVSSDRVSAPWCFSRDAVPAIDESCALGLQMNAVRGLRIAATVSDTRNSQTVQTSLMNIRDRASNPSVVAAARNALSAFDIH